MSEALKPAGTGSSLFNGWTILRNDYFDRNPWVHVLQHGCTLEKPPFWRSSPAPGDSSYRSGRNYDFVVRNARDCYSGRGACSPRHIPVSRSSALYGFLCRAWNVDSTGFDLAPFDDGTERCR